MKQKHNFSCVILAAGKGTRMKSDMPKVMHKIAGKPLVCHVISALDELAPKNIVTVIAPHMEDVKKAASKQNPAVRFANQSEQLGTGHAVSCAENGLAGYDGKILILYGDTPLITPQTLRNLLDVASSCEIAVLAMRPENPFGYGRMITSGEKLLAIVEEKDASAEQKKINLCNSGIMAVSSEHLFALLKTLNCNNKAGEYYLTDIVAAANEAGLECKIAEAQASELSGINTKAQLAEAEAIFQKLLREKAMAEGVTLIDPASIYLRADTKIATDVIIHPQVVFGDGVTVEKNVEIKSFSHIEGAHIGTGAIIGPFARLRPGSVVGENAHVGNFVELKNTKLGSGAKANHLSYVGDSDVGENANIGAGTITCNYDGVKKHKTIIGSGAFIGSNSSLVAPVTVGAGAVVGAGSVITQNIPDNMLGLERSTQILKNKRVKK